MNPSTKEKFEVTSKTVAIIGGILSAVALVWTLQSSTEQRASELRWKQANLAMELVDTLLSDPRAFDALRMIDWNSRSYQIGADEDALISVENARNALNILNNYNLSPSDIYVRESFDRLFYHMGRMERSLRSELILFEDVRSPLGYYTYILCQEYKTVLTAYMRQLGVDDAQKLLDRFQIEDCEAVEGALPIITGPVNNERLNEEIAEETGFDREVVGEVIAAFLENIKHQVAAGERVSFRGFGLFGRRDARTRKGINPDTGETIVVVGGRHPTFKFGRTIKSAVDKGTNDTLADITLQGNEDLIDSIAEETNLPKDEVQIITKTLLNNVIAHLIRGNDVALAEFGVFGVREREARSGRNPGRGAEIVSVVRKKLIFGAAEEFKEVVRVGDQ